MSLPVGSFVINKTMRRSLDARVLVLPLALSAFAACDDESSSNNDADISGMEADAGTISGVSDAAVGGMPGTGGVVGTGGFPVDSGSGGQVAMTDAANGTQSDVGTPGGPMGTQPIGGVCANTGNCNQVTGVTVCCLTDAIPNCKLETDCDSGGQFISCQTSDNCGGGLVCCDATVRRYCTKAKDCVGEVR